MREEIPDEHLEREPLFAGMQATEADREKRRGERERTAGVEGMRGDLRREEEGPEIKEHNGTAHGRRSRSKKGGEIIRTIYRAKRQGEILTEWQKIKSIFG